MLHSVKQTARAHPAVTPLSALLPPLGARLFLQKREVSIIRITPQPSPQNPAPRFRLTFVESLRRLSVGLGRGPLALILTRLLSAFSCTAPPRPKKAPPAQMCLRHERCPPSIPSPLSITLSYTKVRSGSELLISRFTANILS